jgi:non-ribosomal peptide synthetase-like protein
MTTIDPPTVPLDLRPKARPDQPAAPDAGSQFALSAYAPAMQAGQRLERMFERVCDSWPQEMAVDSENGTWTFLELDWAANQLARHVLQRGVVAGDRVALLLDDPVLGYLGVLAVLKAGATYVPMDVGFPADRIRYILNDADATLLLTCTPAIELVDGLAGMLDTESARVLLVDRETRELATWSSRRLAQEERGTVLQEAPAYLIYTSGSTGRPKGVAVSHQSICNFVWVAAGEYAIRRDDRMYQGLTLAFDFAVEETWVPWIAGACVVPKPSGPALVGKELHEFLTERRISALCCVPTVLATMDEDLPELRFLLVSGEACPQDLIERWYRPDRRFLNVYGPTEATVTATWTQLDLDRPVTIGVPLPTYTIVILDRDDPARPLPPGETGEIGIAGVGLADGYVNQPEKTAAAFVPDVLGLPENPSGRIYRTGDLGRIDQRGEIEYLGRIDLQVKVRGYRIELTEIESAMLAVPGVAAAVVDTLEPSPGQTELAGYFSVRDDAGTLDGAVIDRALRERLPAYMVPAYMQRLDAIPMTPNDKVDREALPTPDARRTSDGPVEAPANATEEMMAEVLARVLGLERVSVTADFFSELGANSLLMSQFTAKVRERSGGATRVSTSDVYQSTTIRGLAELAGHPRAVLSSKPPATTQEWRLRAGEGGRTLGRGGGIAYTLTGLAQTLLFVLAATVGATVLDGGLRWLWAVADPAVVLGRAAVFGFAMVVIWWVLPIAAKWLLVGRWKAGEIRLWSPGYLRFWVVRVLVQTSPLVVLAGSPLYGHYLRALGARVGRDVVVESRTVPVATDLISIGDRAVMRRDCSFTGYRGEDGRLRLAQVSIGAEALVGANTVLDVDTEVGEGAQLGHSSALQRGQRVPAGESWHGTPAEQATAQYRTLPAEPADGGRKLCMSALVLTGLFVVGPAVFAAATLAIANNATLAGLLAPGVSYLGHPLFYAGLVALVAVLAIVGPLLAMLFMVTVPRALQLFVRPGHRHRMYGLRYVLHQVIGGLSNSRLLVLLLGDSAYVVAYLRALGYRLAPVEQTGSNFGTQLRHDTPLHTRIGTGTIVSDGLSLVHTELSSGDFRVRPVRVGERNFLGNDITFPAGARTGDNVLLATKVMVPVDGEIRHDTGLLGSPPIKIPRVTQRDDEPLPEGGALRRALVAKNRYNARSIVWAMLMRAAGWLIGLLIIAVAADVWRDTGPVAILGALIALPVALLTYGALLERGIERRHPLESRSCTIYDPVFWEHERLWKFYTTPTLRGTPMQTLLWRLAGLKIGRRVFDDGFVAPEKKLVNIGDDAVLNAGSVVQCHSLEDGYCQTDHTVVGDHAVLGVKAFVHYGVEVGHAASVGAHAFVLKGEHLGIGERWEGNPAVPSD